MSRQGKRRKPVKGGGKNKGLHQTVCILHKWIFFHFAICCVAFGFTPENTS
jgi:hypothetical protein